MNVPTTTDQLVEDLAGLRVHAPSALAPRVLIDLGLADGYDTLRTPLGDAYLAWNGRGVSWVDISPDDRTFKRRCMERTGRTVSRAALPHALARGIERRLAGDRRARVALDLRGHTAFEVAVWMKALEIPRGEVRPYGWIAAEIGHPKAARAVGTALAHNPVPLVVPCHRVIRSDGMIGQYSLGGPPAKRRVLSAEGLDPDRLEADARSGVRYVGSDSTHIVCLPTCRHATRVTTPHRVAFRSLNAAMTAHYRPCRICRPASGTTVAA